MTRTEILDLRDATAEKLISEGWSYDQARFATMTAINKPATVLSEQPTGKPHPALTELAQKVTGTWQPVSPAVKSERVNSDNEMEDQ